MANSKLIRKLKNAYQCCKECGSKYGVYSVGCSSSWIGTCDVCGRKEISVTETRDYAYLYTGITKLQKETQTMDSETNEKTKVKYLSKITQFEIRREDGGVADYTLVTLEDEGGGPYLRINSKDGSEIALDFEEVDMIFNIAQRLKNQ